MWVNVTAEIDPDDVFSQLDDKQLRDLGLARIDRAHWDDVSGAIRRNDFALATRLMNEIATKTGGDLPPFAFAAIA